MQSILYGTLLVVLLLTPLFLRTNAVVDSEDFSDYPTVSAFFAGFCLEDAQLSQMAELLNEI